MNKPFEKSIGAKEAHMMKKIFVILIALFLAGSFSAKAADLSGTAEIHSRLIDVGGGGNYSENPTMAASFT